jgi:hypothetical protein
MAKSKIIATTLISLLLMVALLGCASTPKSSSTGEFIDDSVITAKVKTLLAQDAGLEGVSNQCGDIQRRGSVERFC